MCVIAKTSGARGAKLLMSRHSCACRRVSRCRQDWKLRHEPSASSSTPEAQERASQALNQRHRQYDERTRTLLFSNLFMRSFAEQHRSLAQFVDGMRLMLTDDEQRLMHGWRMLKAAWSMPRSGSKPALAPLTVANPVFEPSCGQANTMINLAMEPRL